MKRHMHVQLVESLVLALALQCVCPVADGYQVVVVMALQMMLAVSIILLFILI